MRPTSEDEARRRLTSAGFEIRGEKILLPLGRRAEDVSVSEADCINFLDQDCGYGFDARVRPKPEHEKYIHWHQADSFLQQCGFTISYDEPNDTYVIKAPPDFNAQNNSLLVSAIKYLTEKWNYTYAKLREEITLRTK